LSTAPLKPKPEQKKKEELILIEMKGKLTLKLVEKKREVKGRKPDHLVEIIHENSLPIRSHSSGAFDDNDELELRHLQNSRFRFFSRGESLGLVSQFMREIDDSCYTIYVEN